MNNEKFTKIREEQYPLTAKCAYFDTATTGLYSTRTRDVMINFIETRYQEGMDIEEFLNTWKYAESLRNTVAKVINADSDEIFFSNSGSDMLNVFSSGIELREHANVVTTAMSFPSTPYTWFNRVGKENVKIAQPENGQVSVKELLSLVDENTAVISLCLVENNTGFYHDIKTIGEFCEAHGIYLVVDITQCVCALNIDVKKNHIDFLVATGYKWISGPFGIAFGFVSRRILDKIRPTYVGWTGNKDRHNHSRYTLDLSDGANRFETGSLNWIGLKGIEQSMQIYLELGKEDVEAYILRLTDYLYEKIDGLRDVNLLAHMPPENRSGISIITFPKEWALNDLILEANGIRAHVLTDTTIRISIHYYNNKEDIDKLVVFLESMQNGLNIRKFDISQEEPL